MLVIPIKDSIVYIQPLYLQAEQTAIPELTRVIVVYADKVEMESTLEAALLKVFGQQSGGTASAVGGVSSETTGGALGGSGAGQGSPTSPQRSSSTWMRSPRSARATGRPTAARSSSSARY